MSDLIRRLVALANFEHDGVEIGFEAAGKIIEQAGEIERLRAENTDLRNANQILRDALDAERAELASKQAEIDRLMLEYCPDEMTPEQFDTWAAHQRVSDLKIEAARKGEGG